LTTEDDGSSIARIFAEAIRAHDRLRQADHAPIVAAAGAIAAACAAGGKVLVFGNGGSAADAQHLAAELVVRFQRERRPLAAVALTADTSILTAIGNDDGFDRVFARQIEGLGRPADVALGITTSGRSANVLAGLEAARRLGLRTVALTGADGGPAGRLAEIHINVPEPTARAQEVHRTILHAICEIVERGI
jgi:D-sedoheptulose 7-phosphate isomerase